MTRLPRLKGKELIRMLERAGFQAVRTRGSHTFLKTSGWKNNRGVPVHAGETIGPGLLRAILRDLELSVEELIELL